MRPDYMAVMFLCSGLLSFNAGVWQLFRRGQKRQLLESHENLNKPPLTALPLTTTTEEIDEKGNKKPLAAKDYEFRRVCLEGTFDNEGSALVGPRAVPSYRGAANADESRGGFLVLTPFEVAHHNNNNENNKNKNKNKNNKNGVFVAVNRGWVPVAAGRHRTFLTQYTGEGFAPATVRGILRREEFVAAGAGPFSLFSSFWGAKKGGSPDNDGPVAEDLSWLAFRPAEMLRRYYARRWGRESVEDCVKAHGAPHYYIEMLEDFSGEDQRMVNGHAWPRRRDVDEVTYVHLTPIVHSMYVVFWWSVTLGSLYGLSRCWQRQKAIFAMRKRMNVQATLLETKRQEEAKAYFAAMQEVERLKQVGAAGGAAAVAGQIGHDTTAQKQSEVLPDSSSDKK